VTLYLPGTLLDKNSGTQQLLPSPTLCSLFSVLYSLFPVPCSLFPVRYPSMSDTPASTTGSVRLEELLALNEEIAALVRAGVPLELGLREYGSSMRGAIGRLSQRLSDRMENGLSLQEALDEEGDHLPGVYRAVVEAGLRAGRLPEALETLSRVARSLLALHRQVVSALIYPAIVLVLIFLMTFAFAEYIIPVFLDTWEALRLEPGTWACEWAVGITARLQPGDWCPVGCIVLPGCLALCAITTWRLS